MTIAPPLLTDSSAFWSRETPKNMLMWGMTVVYICILFYLFFLFIYFFFYFLWHVPQARHHLPTIIVWNSPIQELIDSVMVSSFLLPICGTLSHLHFFRLPSTFLPSKARSITTLGTRQHDIFFFYIYILYTLTVSLSLGVANNTKKKKGGITLVLPAMSRDPAEFGWHCWSNTAHSPLSSTT